MLRVSSLLLSVAAVVANTRHEHEHDAHILGTGIKDASRLWPRGEVVYSINTGSTNPFNPAEHFLAHDEPVITTAIAHWEAKTCIRFKRVVCLGSCRRVEFISDKDSCNGPVGSNGEGMVNQINIAKECSLGAVIHVLGDTLGLLHEHQRSDRDEYVTVDLYEVSAGKEANFEKVSSSSGRSIGPYDYDSIMHYGASAFTRRGRPTIISPYPIGQRSSLSAGDVASVHFLYNNCSATYAAPRCTSSRSVDVLHVIPHSKMWAVEFSAMFDGDGRIEVTYDGSTVPAKMSETSVFGPSGREEATARIQFTPTAAAQGGTYRLAAMFSASGLSSMCAVDVTVASSSAVCFGIPADDPNVCGGRGTCVDSTVEPCQCNSPFGGHDCSGFATCPANLYESFDEDTGAWVSYSSGNAITTNHTAHGRGALVVGGVQAQLNLADPIHVRRITFDIAGMSGASSMLSFRDGNENECWNMAYSSLNRGWSLDRWMATDPGEYDTWYHMDFIMNWETMTYTLHVTVC